MVNKTIFSQLIKYDKGNFAPAADLAEKWEVSPDGLTWTFTLRKGVTWHDGKPFTSADAKFSIEVYKDEKINSILRSNLTPVNRIETPEREHARARDAGQVLVAARDPLLPRLHAPEAPPRRQGHDQAARGVHQQPDRDRAVQVRGARSGRPPDRGRLRRLLPRQPKVDQVIYKIIPDVNTTVAQVRTGELDIAFIGTSHLDALKGASNVRIAEANQMDMRHIGFNHKNPRVGKWFSDKKVRQALAYAIDKQADHRGGHRQAWPIRSPARSRRSWATGRTRTSSPGRTTPTRRRRS